MWPAFVLVSGLLLVGVAAERDGLFAAAGTRLGSLPLGPRGLFVVALLLVTGVTAVLNLDTSVFFLTPVLLHLARARGADERPFLYGTVFMSNAASLFLPGSNLTNLIVLHHEHVAGAVFLARMWPAAITAPVATALVLLVVFRRELAGAGEPRSEREPVRLGAGTIAVAVSTVLVLVLAQPAVPVLACGIAAVVLGRTRLVRIRDAVDPRTLAGLFALAVLVGAIGQWWGGPARLLGSIGRWPAGGVAVLASVCLNNLPAAVLFTPDPPAHARALLVGLNLGPNLAVTGSLSAVLWLRVARSLGAEPSMRTYSRIGLVLVPVSVAATLAALFLA